MATTSASPPGIGDVLTDLGRSTWASVPTALAFLAVLTAGYLLARTARRLVHRGLTRVGFDRALRRTALRRVLPGPPEQPSALCATLVHHVVLLLALHVAFGLWGPNPVSALIDTVVAWLPRAGVAIVVVVVAATVAHAVRDLTRSALGSLRSGRVIGSVCHAVVLGLGVVAALAEVGIASSVTTPVLVAILGTVAGILVVGVGGGLVRPMQRRCARWLDRLLAEAYRASSPPAPGVGASGPGVGANGPGVGASGPGVAASGPGFGASGPGVGASGSPAGPHRRPAAVPVAGEPGDVPVAGEQPAGHDEPTVVLPVAATDPVGVEPVTAELAAVPVTAGPVRWEPTVYRSDNAAADPPTVPADDTQRLDLEELRSR